MQISLKSSIKINHSAFCHQQVIYDYSQINQIIGIECHTDHELITHFSITLVDDYCTQISITMFTIF